MADFHATQTDNTSVGDSIRSLWNEQTLLEAGYELVVDQFATVRQAGAPCISRALLCCPRPRPL